jgi:gas vesicle protein
MTYQFVTILFMVLVLAACGDDKKEAMKQQRDGYATQMEGKLKDYDRRIDAMKTKGDALPDDRKAEFNQMMDTVKQKRDVAGKMVDEVKNSPVEQWESRRAASETAIKELEDNLNQMAARFP